MNRWPISHLVKKHTNTNISLNTDLRTSLFAWLHSILPESARWLAAKGHLTQAHDVLMKFASKKSSPVDSDALKHKLNEYHQGEVESKTIAYLTKNQSYLELVRSLRLRKRTIILSFNWWVAETYLIGSSRSWRHLTRSLYEKTLVIVPVYIRCKQLRNYVQQRKNWASRSILPDANSTLRENFN